MVDRLPPHDLDAERAVISASVLSAEALDDAKGTLPDPADFYDRGHQAIWRAILQLDDEGAVIDLVTVARRLRDSGDIDKAGGTPGLATIINETPAVAHVETHARIVADLALQRRVVAHLAQFQIEGHQGQPSPTAWAQRVAEGLQDAIEDRAAPDAPSFSEILQRLTKDINARRQGVRAAEAVPTGLPALDRKLSGGLFRGNLYIAAGRPGMGKTSYGLERCDAVAATQRRAAIFCGLEMPVEQVAARLISMRSGVPVNRIQGAKLNDEELQSVTDATQLASRLPIGLEDCDGMTVGGIRTAIRRRMRKLRKTFGEDLDLGLVVVDYMQLVRPPRLSGRTRENEVSEVSAGFKTLAKQLKCPVLVLSQLNRELEKRPNKRPVMSDLRESGSLEQDAYAIMFLYRDSYYWDDEKKAAEKAKGEADVCEIIVAKHRNGETGTVKVGWEPKTTSFYPLEELHYDPDFGALDYDDLGGK